MEAIVNFTKKIDKEKSILKVAKNSDVKIKAPCEKGKCGKCKVIANGELSELTKSEKKALSKKEIESGYRLACEAVIKGNVEIKL